MTVEEKVYYLALILKNDFESPEGQRYVLNKGVHYCPVFENYETALEHTDPDNIRAIKIKT